jgi:predicted ATP-grasp superfamily ATP-dependent carboligase
VAAQRTILVTDAGLGSSISIIRSLGRSGWRVVAGDAHRGSLGFRSRHAAERLVYPSPASLPAEFVQCLLAAVSQHAIDLIIPVTDAAILPLSAERSRFTGMCRVAMPDADSLDRFADKERTLALAAELGIPVPRSARVGSVQEGMRIAAQFGWPVVLKPKSSRVYRNRTSVEAFEVTYANGREDMSARLARLEGRSEILVQEFCPGAGHGIGLLMHEGRPLAAFQHRRVHELPLTGGASSLRESVPLDPVLYDHSVRLLSAQRWTGLAMVEFKIGPAGAVLMEVNGRIWGSLPLAVMCGVDFPRLLAELYLDGPPPEGSAPLLQYRVGVRARNLTLDMVWIAAALSGIRRYPFLKTPGRGRGLVGLLELLDPRCRLDLLAADDPWPAFAEMPRMVGTLWDKVRTIRNDKR